MRTAASPSVDTSTRGGKGSQSRQQAADGIEQQVAVRADAAAEDDELDVGDCGDRRDVQRDAPGLLRHDRAAARSPLRAAPKTARASAGLPAGWEREHGECGAARVERVVTRACVVELAGGAVAAAVDLAAEDDPGAQAGSDREEDEVVDSARDPGHCSPSAARFMSFSSVTGSPSALRASRRKSRPSSPARSSRGVTPVLRLDNAGDPDDDVVDQAGSRLLGPS